MWTDEVVEEVRKAREAHAAAHGRDLYRIFQDVRQKQDASGRKVATLSPRPPRTFNRAVVKATAEGTARNRG
jgi:hypothetical protein